MATLYDHIAHNKRKTVFLVILYVAIITGLVFFLSRAYGYGPEVVIAATSLSVAMSLISYYTGDRVALAASGAKSATLENNPYVVRMIENLAITAGIPTPRVYVINDPAINAFATGRDPKHASI